MKIDGDRLHDDDGLELPFEESPNTSGSLTPRYLVMHYTAGASARHSINWLINPDARASAHVVIGRNGTVTQLVPFDRVAWHAGRSSWEGIVGLNRHSIGIELDNAGKLRRQGGVWRSWFGQDYPDAEVMEATHPNEAMPTGWHVYTQVQLDAAFELAHLLVRRYGLLDVLGHEDISPFRKTDPGPAFPMANFRSRIFGREDGSPELLESTAHLNIRVGPGTGHDRLPASPLAPGTAVEVLNRAGVWAMVDVVGETSGEGDVQGWVHGGYLRRPSPG